MFNGLNLFFLLLLLAFTVFAIWYIRKSHQSPGEINPLLLDAIPGIFTTIGILGTFIGIFVALLGFNVQDINGSIPQLLSGLKTAFITSIVGLIESVIFARFVEYAQHKMEAGMEITDEFTLLKNLVDHFIQFREENKDNMKQLINSIRGDEEDSMTTQLVKLRTTLRDEMSEQKKMLEAIRKALGGDDETSLLTQMQKMRQEQFDLAKENRSHLENIRDVLIESRDYIGRKFEEFGELLEKSNTEALVKAIENVIGGFNERLNELIERLVKENFEELNQSVQRLNEWQQENKEQVARLIEQFRQVSSELSLTSENLENISRYTKDLVEGEGKLKDLITELEKVLTKNTMLRESAEQLLQASDQLKESSVTLKNWMEMEKDFGENIELLIESLKEIEKLRDKTGEFWSDIKERMNEGIQILENGNKELLQKVEAMDQAFYDRLNTSFRNLDMVLQNMVAGYAERLKSVLNTN
jgi:DNA repair exonuclease SbcCD ATPase subunit